MTFDHGYALLVGVGKCRDPKWSLPTTVQDMKALRRILTDPNLCAYADDEEHVRYLHDKGAKHDAILDGLAWLQRRAQADPEATVVVFFSGHGVLDQSDLTYYLVPHDFERARAAEVGISATQFTAALGAIAARRLLVFIDACHAGELAAAKGEGEADGEFASVAPPKPVVTALQQGEGRVVCMSSLGKQRSWVRPDGKLSVFTYHLIEALQGAGNKAGDTLVHVSHLMTHLGQAVPTTARSMFSVEQTPYFDTKAEDFPVAMLRGGKGLAPGGWYAVAVEAEAQRESLVKKVKVVKVTAGDGGFAAETVKAKNIKVGNTYYGPKPDRKTPSKPPRRRGSR